METENVKRHWSIYKSLVFEVSLGDEGFTYHLSDGTWYRVADTLVTELREYLSPYWTAANLPDHANGSEGKYNEHVGEQPGFRMSRSAEHCTKRSVSD